MFVQSGGEALTSKSSQTCKENMGNKHSNRCDTDTGEYNKPDRKTGAESLHTVSGIIYKNIHSYPRTNKHYFAQEKSEYAEFLFSSYYFSFFFV